MTKHELRQSVHNKGYYTTMIQGMLCVVVDGRALPIFESFATTLPTLEGSDRWKEMEDVAMEFCLCEEEESPDCPIHSLTLDKEEPDAESDTQASG